MLCHPDNTVASQVWYFGPYIEWDELLFMTRYLRAGDGVIDAGANIGLYTLLAAPIVGSEGRVDSFEPGLVAAGRLAENVGLNAYGHVYPHRAALSDRVGEVAFSMGWDVSNIMIPEGESMPESELVVVTTLDECLPVGVFAFAKLDVEGAEALALKGAKAHLEAHNPPVWLVEAYDHRLARFGSSPAEVADEFLRRGYVAAAYDAETNTLARMEESAGSRNLLFVADDHWGSVLERLSTES